MKIFTTAVVAGVVALSVMFTVGGGFHTGHHLHERPAG